MRQRSGGRGRPGPRFPLWVELAVTPAVLIVLTTLYVLSLYLSVDAIASTGTDDVTETRDAWYFGAHLAWTAVAVGLGAVLGTWFRRSGFAFAALFLAWISISMTVAQVATFQLACEGHNDIIRHWHC